MSKFDPNTFETARLVKAFREIRVGISDKQFEDLRQLYDRKNGIPYTLDVNNRPQGPTIHSCKSIGTQLIKNLGEGPKYGMSWIGYSNDLNNWAMRNNVRDALSQIGWFGSSVATRNKSDKPGVEKLAEPLGTKYPNKTTTEVTQYERNSVVRDWVLSKANGHCECCKQKAPFATNDGFPYLEIHHLRHLADGGSDTTSNTVALCPNCHREMHHGNDKDELVKNLYAYIPRLKRE